MGGLSPAIGPSNFMICCCSWTLLRSKRTTGASSFLIGWKPFIGGSSGGGTKLFSLMLTPGMLFTALAVLLLILLSLGVTVTGFSSLLNPVLPPVPLVAP